MTCRYQEGWKHDPFRVSVFSGQLSAWQSAGVAAKPLCPGSGSQSCSCMHEGSQCTAQHAHVAAVDPARVTGAGHTWAWHCVHSFWPGGVVMALGGAGAAAPGSAACTDWRSSTRHAARILCMRGQPADCTQAAPLWIAGPCDLHACGTTCASGLSGAAAGPAASDQNLAS